MKNKRIAFLVISTWILQGTAAFSQALPDSLPPKLNDTLHHEIILQETDISIDDDVNLDSLIMLANAGSIDSTSIPSARLYGYSWNNLLVNPYGQRMVEMPDTVCIDFSHYVHPNCNVVTSGFGFRRGWRFHYGIDTRLKTGDSIRSSFDGMVRISRRGRAYGNYVVVRHFNGLETVYGHLSKSLVTVNQFVHAGEVIGLGGNTGRSTGPHLHYELRYLGQPLPPNDYIDWETFTPRYAHVELSAQSFAYVKDIEKIRFYTIRRGDTLSGIAHKTGVSVSKLCQLNRLTRKSILRIGRRIRIT